MAIEIRRRQFMSALGGAAARGATDFQQGKGIWTKLRRETHICEVLLNACAHWIQVQLCLRGDDIPLGSN